jgi:hypothetical protein
MRAVIKRVEVRVGTDCVWCEAPYEGDRLVDASEALRFATRWHRFHLGCGQPGPRVVVVVGAP